MTWPLLLAGLGVGALASQLGSVTVAAVEDDRSGEVGGLQNAVTNLGASVGTAFAGAVVDDNEAARIAALRSSLAVLAFVALIALFTARSLPNRQPGSRSPPA